jgi:hypothetical protein
VIREIARSLPESFSSLVIDGNLAMPPPIFAFSIYAAKNAAGDTLYVGRSECPKRRLETHKSKAVWWKECKSVEFVFVETRSKLLIAECKQIVALSPKHNRVIPFRMHDQMREMRPREK